MRDGEQSPGASMSLEEKTQISRVFDEMGIDIIEAGFPIASPGDFEAVKAISKILKNSIPAGLSRHTKKDIDACYEALKAAPRFRIHTFISTSPLHMKHKLNKSPEEIIRLVEESGLKGRGGAYFPTATKWKMASTKTSIQKYLIVNCEEGEPGVFKDRLIMEHMPFKLIEGALIASYANNCSNLVFYINGEAENSFNSLKNSLSQMEKNGIIVQERIEIARLDTNSIMTQEFKQLSQSQSLALDEIHMAFEEDKVAMLHGVTGSGKTEIYVQLIQEHLDLGQQVLFLLPEIALTTQLIQRLSAYFGEQIGVYHSKFNQNERIEIWNHVLNDDMNKYRIILGARSSIFLPYRNLGLIIVDEEHESSYKQYDPSPRYNARDCAIVLSTLHNAKIVLGSATPSIESYYNAKSNKYKLVELNDRFGKVLLPDKKYQSHRPLKCSIISTDHGKALL